MMYHQIIAQFGEAMARAGLPCNEICGDGQIRRFHVDGDRVGSLNGWYLLYTDGVPAGRFGSWKSGAAHSWTASGKASSIRFSNRILSTARLKRAVEVGKARLGTASRAARLWQGATPADEVHPYLERKRVKPSGLRQIGKNLLVPLYYEGKLVNIQRIDTCGNKRFLSGGLVTGCYTPIGSLSADSKVLLCEGWATGATLHEKTGHPVLCTLNCHNLFPVAKWASRFFSVHQLVIAADDDRKTDGNPGKSAATRTARELGIPLITPPWPDKCPEDMTDFNDFYCWLDQQNIQVGDF